MRHLDNGVSGTQKHLAAFSGFPISAKASFDELIQVPD